MEGIAERLAKAYPLENARCGVILRPLREVFSGDVRPAILVLLGAVVFVLLIACANLSNLFLMRGAVRSREMALRIAIGASRARIAGQVLTEGFLVAVLGGAAGVALALAGIRGIAILIPRDSLAGASIEMNPPVLLFSAALVLLSMFAFGLAPALHSTSANLQAELKEGSKATNARGRSRWRTVLATAEIAFALILLVGAGLMTRSLYLLLSVDSGFRAEQVMKVEMSLRTEQYDKDPAIRNFWQKLLDGVRALPGVRSAAVGTAIPLTDDHWRTDIWVEGQPLPDAASFPHPDMHVVSPDFISAMGIRLLHGRSFVETDRETAPLVALVNETFAQRLFPGGDPVGRRGAAWPGSCEPHDGCRRRLCAAAQMPVGLSRYAHLAGTAVLREARLRGFRLARRLPWRAQEVLPEEEALGEVLELLVDGQQVLPALALAGGRAQQIGRVEGRHGRHRHSGSRP